jgi:hypothetical protein
MAEKEVPQRLFSLAFFQFEGSGNAACEPGYASRVKLGSAYGGEMIQMQHAGDCVLTH